jgi:hypothetical protein
MTIDHLCINSLCVNPQHLEMVTCNENSSRANKGKMQCWSANYCPRGHRSVVVMNDTFCCKRCGLDASGGIVTPPVGMLGMKMLSFQDQPNERAV